MFLLVFPVPFNTQPESSVKLPNSNLYILIFITLTYTFRNTVKSSQSSNTCQNNVNQASATNSPDDEDGGPPFGDAGSDDEPEHDPNEPLLGTYTQEDYERLKKWKQDHETFAKDMEEFYKREGELEDENAKEEEDYEEWRCR